MAVKINAKVVDESETELAGEAVSVAEVVGGAEGRDEDADLADWDVVGSALETVEGELRVDLEAVGDDSNLLDVSACLALIVCVGLAIDVSVIICVRVGVGASLAICVGIRICVCICVGIRIYVCIRV